MRILIAEDDPVSRHRLESHVSSWGHQPMTATDGVAAWDLMQRDDAPPLALVDWMMPGVDGVELCRRARARGGASPPYIILLTSRADRQDTVDGLGAGADDYVTKPYHAAELRARVNVGIRMVALQAELAARIVELERALAHVDRLHGTLPICSYCKNVRTGDDSWQRVEAYVSTQFAQRFTHGVCPVCVTNVLQPELDELRRSRTPR